MAIRIRRLLIVTIASILICGIYVRLDLAVSSAYASEEEKHAVKHEEEKAHYEESGRDEEGKGEHGKEGEAVRHAEGPPFLYYLYWVGLIGITITGGRYLLAYQKGSATKDDLTLARLLIALGILLYLINQIPALKTYHEPSSIGFVRFLVKLVAGTIMTFFSFTWMHEHH